MRQMESTITNEWEHLVQPTERQRHVCRECGRIFTRSDNLVRHTASVHGRHRHECSVCRRVYTRYDNLQKHIKKEHEVTTPATTSRKRTVPSVDHVLTDKRQKHINETDSLDTLPTDIHKIYTDTEDTPESAFPTPKSIPPHSPLTIPTNQLTRLPTY
jgi:uncharacterized Zn-finger protein